MIINETRDFVDRWDEDYPEDKAHIVLLVDDKTDEQIQEMMQRVKSMGYCSMLQKDAFGTKIVVTDVVE